MPNVNASEELQAEHYDRIVRDYDRHYSDEYSVRYRNEFFYSPLFANVPLRGARVLEAMCGTGQATEYLLNAGAEVLGVDVSNRAVELFQAKWPASNCICRSILATELEDESFDVIVVIGGLHHLHPHLDQAFNEFHRLLKAGGSLCFIEPNAGTFFDMLRRLWYRVDPLFAENEAAIDIAALEAQHAQRFDFVSTTYGGGIAYILVFNSMVLRLPLRLKRWLSPPLLLLERWVEMVLPRYLSF